MRQAVRQNWVLLLFLALTAAIFALFGCPYLRERGHTEMCVLVYVLLVLIYIFGRVTQGRPRPKAPPAGP